MLGIVLEFQLEHTLSGHFSLWLGATVLLFLSSAASAHRNKFRLASGGFEAYNQWVWLPSLCAGIGVDF